MDMIDHAGRGRVGPGPQAIADNHLAGAADHAQNISLLHDQTIHDFDLGLNAGAGSLDHLVTYSDLRHGALSVFVKPAASDRQNASLLRLLLHSF
jgi:hypothetical protein